MGTSATTRISSANDYIELNTRWDGFHEEISEQVHNTLKDWKFTVTSLKESITKSDQGTSGIVEWISNLEDLVNQYESHKTIENLSVLLSARSFSHHHVLPHKLMSVDAKGNKIDQLSYYNKNSPTMTFNIDSDLLDTKVHDIHFDYVLNKEIDADDLITIELTAKSIDPVYKVARISMLLDNGEFDPDNYLDIKFKNMTEEELAYKVLRLPQFFRDVYMFTKEHYENTDRFHEKSNKPIYKLGKKLSQYYVLTQNYGRYYSSSQSERYKLFPDRNDTERAATKEELLEMINDMIPLDFDISAMATHLFISGASSIFPMTEAEKLSEYPIAINIGVLNMRLANVVVNIPGNNEHEMTEILNDSTYNIQVNEDKFNKFHALNLKFEIGEYVKSSPEISTPFVGIPYEKNLIHFFDSQHDIEIKEYI